MKNGDAWIQVTQLCQNDLDITRCCVNLYVDKSEPRIVYTLVGVVVHTQLFQGCGHYTSFVRSQVDKSQWIHADDDEVITFCHCAFKIKNVT